MPKNIRRIKSGKILSYDEETQKLYVYIEKEIKPHDLTDSEIIEAAPLIAGVKSDDIITIKDC